MMKGSVRARMTPKGAASAQIRGAASPMCRQRKAKVVAQASVAPAAVSSVTGFHTKDDGHVYCDSMRIMDVRSQVPESPFYLYSKDQLTSNYEAYSTALSGIDSIIGYAIKANNNFLIMKHFREMGSGAVLVSGNELACARAAGYDPNKIVFNGNGKLYHELVYAAKEGVLINIDSEFDLENIRSAAKEAGKPAKVLLRINPDVDPQVSCLHTHTHTHAHGAHTWKSTSLSPAGPWADDACAIPSSVSARFTRTSRPGSRAPSSASGTSACSGFWTRSRRIQARWIWWASTATWAPPSPR